MTRHPIESSELALSRLIYSTVPNAAPDFRFVVASMVQRSSNRSFQSKTTDHHRKITT
jgi:hypothetical protein